jgi:hypothetical protein
MASWVGATEGHLTFLPNKPHPLGFCLKTVCDARAGIFLNVDIQEGAAVQS